MARTAHNASTETVEAPEVVKPNAPERKPDEVTAPGEAIAGEKTIKVKATGAFLVFDPSTLDYVSEEGGEMRLTEFVRNKIADESLKEI